MPGSIGIGRTCHRPTPSLAPARAGRDRDVIEAVLEHLVGASARCRRRSRRSGASRAGPCGSRRTRIHAASPGSARLAQHPPAELVAGVGQHHVVAAPAERHRSLQPGRGRRRRPAPCPRSSSAGSARGASRAATPRPWSGSGCSAAGCSVKSPETQMLQPMHSRMSSPAPLFDLLRQERVGDATGAAAPIMSSVPSRTIRTIVSGDVKRPTPTTGLVVNCLSPLT